MKKKTKFLLVVGKLLKRVNFFSKKVFYLLMFCYIKICKIMPTNQIIKLMKSVFKSTNIQHENAICKFFLK